MQGWFVFICKANTIKKTWVNIHGDGKEKKVSAFTLCVGSIQKPGVCNSPVHAAVIRSNGGVQKCVVERRSWPTEARKLGHRAELAGSKNSSSSLSTSTFFPSLKTDDPDQLPNTLNTVILYVLYYLFTVVMGH